MSTVIKVIVAAVVFVGAFAFAFGWGESLFNATLGSEDAPSEFSTTVTLEDPAMDIIATTSVPARLTEEMASNSLSQEGVVNILIRDANARVAENCGDVTGDDKIACVEGLDFSFNVWDE